MPPQNPSSNLEMQNPLPQSNPQDNGQKENGQKKVGPIIASLIIVLVLIIAALYVFAVHLNQQAIPTDDSTSGVDSYSTEYNSTTTIQTVQPINDKADDPQSLENDLNKSTTGLNSQSF